MIVEMLLYLFWIIALLFVMTFVFWILSMDQSRGVKVVVRQTEGEEKV